jgi:transposase InsO family protein
MGCFDFEIIFRPGKQSSKPDALSRRPDLAPQKEDKLTFGQLLRPENITAKTFAEISEFDTWFVDEAVTMDNAEFWFQVDVMGVDPEDTGHREVEEPMLDLTIIKLICKLTPLDPRLAQFLSLPNKEGGAYSHHDELIYQNGRIEVPASNEIKHAIVKRRHDSQLVGHPGQAKTLALVKRCFTWPSMKRFVNRYVEGCDLCQRNKPSTLQPLGSLEPLPIPAGPWTDISYNMITDLPTSNGRDSILTVIDRLTKMAHFIPFQKTMCAKQLADLMLRHVWKLHGTPKTIISDRGSVFISQITKELNKRLGIKIQPSTAYHPRTDGQSEIANKSVEQYLRHYVQYHQDDWEGLLPMAEFAYNNCQPL